MSKSAYRSKVHNKAIALGKVNCEIKDNIITISHNNHSKSFNIPEYMVANLEDKSIRFVTKEGLSLNKKEKSMWGTLVRLVSNAIEGFTKGFSKILYLKGVGFRGTITKDVLDLKIGFSHNVQVKLMESVDVKIEESKRDPKALGPFKITVSGIDKQAVGDMADKIVKARPYNPCLCNGIVYSDSILIKKSNTKGGK